jgi:hypothetical protein
MCRGNTPYRATVQWVATDTDPSVGINDSIVVYGVGVLPSRDELENLEVKMRCSANASVPRNTDLLSLIHPLTCTTKLLGIFKCPDWEM